MQKYHSDCDVLVIGGGAAALCAAISARQAGASVAVVEKAPKEMRGGNSRHSRNLRIMHPAASALFPASYGEEEFLSDIRHVADGAADDALASLLVRQSMNIPEWLAANGVVFQTTASKTPPPWSRKTAFLMGGGKAMVNALYATAIRKGVAVFYNSAVAAIEADCSATLMVGGETQRLRARAVIACCGGYQANKAWLCRDWGEGAGNFINRGTPFATGEVLQSLLEMGAASVGVPGACHLVAVDARSPEHDGGVVTRIYGIPLGIVIDRSGCRFHNEKADSGPRRYSLWGKLVAERPGQTATLILDAKSVDRIRPAVFAPIKARTIAELAVALSIDRHILTSTIEQCGSLTAPPFSAFPIRPGVTFTCHGVKVDERARVVSSTGRAYDGLFAAGVIMAPNILGTGYLAGAGVTIGAVFGKIAGEEAARYALG